MDYNSKKREGYHSSTGPKKEESGREKFKKDVAEAVAKGMKGSKKTKPKKMYKGKKDSYDGMSVAELRKLLNQKKHNLLMKAGFPDGKLPRSKQGMIDLCKRLKRKRW